eukprot:GFKZ01007171.1.p1 GENE.GFKZ01007171.1~~GFKZ01007171.1.p1  ORF type:complete len:455 (+),score=60.27 GFKZ01007171.1:97-1461(+)
MRSTQSDTALTNDSVMKSSRGLRQRLGKLSESMLSILTPPDSKPHVQHSTHGYTVLVSRAVVILLISSLILGILSGLFHSTISLFSTPNSLDRDDSAGHLRLGATTGLRVEDYPTVLVADSEPFKAKGADTEDTDAQASLVSAPSDTEVARAPNVDVDEEPVARLIVITMDREDSLKRLLESLTRSNYGEDHVDLDIWIDKAKDKPLHDGVLHACRTTDWKQGTKTIHKRVSNAGLYEQWIYTWNITQETTEFAVILEDDLEVSPSFYQWLRVARAAYAQDPDVGAFTLQRPTLRPRQIKGVATGPLRIPSEHPIFKYRLLGTWGFAPQRDTWVEFRKWFEEKKESGEKPYVNGLVTTEWYKSQEVDGYAPTMWSQWWIKFVDEKGYFTVTANLPDGSTLASNWREAGLHYSSSKPKADFPVFRGNDEQFIMPDNPILVDWDGRVISANMSTTS